MRKIVIHPRKPYCKVVPAQLLPPESRPQTVVVHHYHHGTTGQSGRSHFWTFGVFLLPFLLILGIFVGNFHFLLGENVQDRIVRRESFGFSEFIVDMSTITHMPYLDAKRQHPKGVAILQREHLIESEASFQNRVRGEVVNELVKIAVELDKAFPSQ